MSEVRLGVRQSILAQAVRELVVITPWGHHVELLNKVKDPAAHIYYIRATAKLR